MGRAPDTHLERMLPSVVTKRNLTLSKQVTDARIELDEDSIDHPVDSLPGEPEPAGRKLHHEALRMRTCIV